MKTRILEILACVSCGDGALRLSAGSAENYEILAGTLTCTSCGSLYPVRRGIPRFVPDDAYTGNFSAEWSRFSRVQFDREGDPRSSREFFSCKTRWPPGDLAGCLVLDAGCGGGRYMDVAERARAEVVGVDLSNAVDSCFENVGRRRRAHVVQADINALPFRRQIFDKIYALGVLHHTPAPRRSFTDLARFLKPDGEISIWVYETSLPIRMKDLVFRQPLRRLPLLVVRGIARLAHLVYAIHRIPVLGRTMRALSPPFSVHPDPQWRLLDTFDWLTPRYQWLLRRDEVRDWFEQAGFEDIRVGNPGIAASGRKTATDPTASDCRGSSES